MMKSSSAAAKTQAVHGDALSRQLHCFYQRFLRVVNVDVALLGVYNVGARALYLCVTAVTAVTAATRRVRAHVVCHRPNLCENKCNNTSLRLAGSDEE